MDRDGGEISLQESLANEFKLLMDKHLRGEDVDAKLDATWDELAGLMTREEMLEFRSKILNRPDVL